MKMIVRAASAALLMTACGGGSSTNSSGAGGSPIAAPQVGVQLSSTTVTLATAEERYVCWSVETPSAFSIVGTQTGMPSSAVHHYAVFTSSKPLPANPNAYDCSAMDASWGLITGGGRSTPGFDFPKGVGMPIPQGQHVILQLHLLNASGKSLTVDTQAINLNGSTDASLQKAGVVIAGNLDLAIAPHASGQQVQGGCAAPKAMQNVFALFPHMHTMGTHIAMSVAPKGASAPNVLLDQSWDFGTQGVYPASATVAAGDQLTVTCSFTNPSDKTVYFGESTNDEMCLGVFYYYPADQPSRYCGF